ncbi:MAG: DUF169 domain-containing protein [Dehalococcoidia bacterium]
MALSCADLSALLEEQLQLQRQPVALALVQEQPSDVPRLDAVVPSGCAMWRRAETELFFAVAEDHFNCPLGSMVMGFQLPDEQMAKVMEEVGMMCGNQYVRESEVEHVPQVPRSFAGIVYGPLWRFPLDPHLVLLWLTPEQAMKMSECCGLMNWATPASGILGRPGCAALPIALTQGKPSQSFGCVGMRINSGAPGDSLLMAVPGNMLENMDADLAAVGQVHQQMEQHYRDRIASLGLSGPQDAWS